MDEANTWKPLGSLTKQIAAKLIVLREGNESAAAPTSGMTDAAARFPVREERGIEGSRNRGFEGGAATPVGGSVAARHPAKDSCHQSGGGLDTKEIRDAARLPRGDGGRQQAAPHVRHPLFRAGE